MTIMLEFKLLTKLATRFKGFVAFAAFAILSAIFLFSWLFSKGGFDIILANFRYLNRDQFFWLVIAVLAMLFLSFLLLVVLAFKRTVPSRKKTQAMVYVVVHEKDDRTAGIDGAQVVLALPEPVNRKSQQNGSANFTIPERYVGRTVLINARKPGYKDRHPSEIELFDGVHEFVSLEKKVDTLLEPTKPQNKVVRYYLYISKSKVDMFWSQLARETIENYAKSSNTSPDDHSLFSKLKIVEYYIVTNLDVGSIDKPGTYFKGTLSMRTTIIQGGRSPFVYFGGIDKNQAVALVGSPKHIWGQPTIPSSEWPGTSYYFLSFILDAFNLVSGEPSELKPKKSSDLSDLYDYVKSFDQEIRGGDQLLEFLAKRLYNSHNSVLGTPIYVALA